MRLLVAVRSCSGFYRFVAPTLAELKDKAEIILLAPDADSFFGHRDNFPYPIERPADLLARITRLLMRIRGAVAFGYWALLGVLSPPALERFGKKFLSAKPLQKFFLASGRFFKSLGLNRFLARVALKAFRLLEDITVDEGVLAHLKAIDPDALLLTPGLYPQGWDIDYMKAGRRLGIPTIIMIASWDHLAGKGLLSAVPDRIFVWNQRQVWEAREYHVVPSNRLVEIGSPAFDWVLDGDFWQERDDFCQQTQLDPARPFILWAASAPGNCLDEPKVVRTIMQEMRKYPILNGYQVLIRPHPSKNASRWEGWQDVDAPVWSTPSFPTNDDVKRGLYNSIAHACAVTGLSTSVFLEAGILDRPVALLRNSEAVSDAVFNKSIHFQYLLENDFPEAAADEADCARWLARIADGDDNGSNARHRFVEDFIRPQGMALPSAQVAAEEILKVMHG